MNYRTIVESKRYDFEISHESNLFLIGSCFSENIGEKLAGNKLNTMVNPFGILFNPISIVNTLTAVIEEKEFTKEDLHFENGLYHSFAHHGKFSGVDSKKVLDLINKNRREATLFLKETDVLIITLGSSWVYKYNKTNEFVANCHKVPNKEFNKELLKVDTIVGELEKVIEKLRTINSKLKVVFTISPVRHWKDGAEENTLSKSILNVAVHQLIEKVTGSHYFPAYEMVIDDLRDYRFYKEDMLHPNNVAVDYVWKGFEKSFFSRKTIELNKEIGKIITAGSHRPFNIDSNEHQIFISQQIQFIKSLKELNPNLDFTKEISIFHSQKNETLCN